jgi:hypothetical protein
MQPEPELVYQAFSAMCETRRLNKAGYVKFRNFFLYGERNLAGETALVDIFQDVLTLEYNQEKLSRYSVEWRPDDRHPASVSEIPLNHLTDVGGVGYALFVEPRTSR